MSSQEKFNKAVSEKASNEAFYAKTTTFSQHFFKQVYKAEAHVLDIERIKKRAAFYRWRTTENLEKYLIEFESNFTKKGGKIIWAPDLKDFNKEATNLLGKYEGYQIAVSPSNIIEETGLYNIIGSRAYQSEGLAVEILRDKWDYSHPQFLLSHLNREEIGNFFTQQLDLKTRTETKEWVEYYRDKNPIKPASKTITFIHPKFAVSDSGTLVFTGNNGLDMSLITQSKVLVVILGIDQMVANINEMETLLPLLSVQGSGEVLNRQLMFVGGPKHSSYEEGPEEIYVMFIDNGRSSLLAQADTRQAAHCIQCGACHMVCPVFRAIGASSYTPYPSGPIGEVSSLYQYPAKDTKHLSYASTHCGACTEVCPVKIDLHNLIIKNRRRVDEMGHTGANEKYLWLAWKRMMLKRKRMNQAASLKSFMFRTAYRKNWGEKRELPNIVERSFNQMWVEQFGTGKED